MKKYISILRPKDWAKNLFLFIPSFFGGVFFNWENLFLLCIGFISFSCTASCLYIINDYRDIKNDRNHPEKCKRPIASGKIKKPLAIFITTALLTLGFATGYLVDSSHKFLFILGIYFFINLGYSLGLKNIAILDILILSTGFVLRIKAGAVLSDTPVSHWLVIMIFLLALLLVIAKRRDDLLLKISTGNDMRKSVKEYSLEFLNTLLALFSAIIIVAYIMYTIDPATISRLQTKQLYYTSLFVIAGLMRYLQITIVNQQSGSPTKILYSDWFIQASLLCWAISFFFILYLRGAVFFSK
jgi:4-hydroxybenzoate polyprenyltransferase